VADAFAYFADDSTTETERFVRYFDRFFDCMNVRCFTECFEHRKPDLRPYRSPKDDRLKVTNSSITHLKWHCYMVTHTHTHTHTHAHTHTLYTAHTHVRSGSRKISYCISRNGRPVLNSEKALQMLRSRLCVLARKPYLVCEWQVC